MSTLAPSLIQAKLLRILHRAFVHARNLAMSGDTQHLYDLTDTFEVVPEFMARWDDTSLDRIRRLLGEYQASHPQSGYNYLAILDMDEEDFIATETRMFHPIPEGAGQVMPGSAVPEAQ